MEGVGLAGSLVSYVVLYYYNVMIAWSLIYFVSSFISPLPWSMQRTQPGTNYKDCANLFVTEE